jgi:hypothetical protein
MTPKKPSNFFVFIKTTHVCRNVLTILIYTVITLKHNRMSALKSLKDKKAKQSPLLKLTVGIRSLQLKTFLV